jgi:putative acetyltransferase
MKIRLFEPKDLGGVIETYGASIRGLAAEFYSQEQIAAWAPLNADLAGWRERLSGLHTIIAEEGNVVAGFAAYTLQGYLDFLYVHPSFARRGVATHLYQKVEWELQGLAVAKVTSHVSLAARPFFDRQGFSVDAEEMAECRGQFLRRFAMSKRLE